MSQQFTVSYEAAKTHDLCVTSLNKWLWFKMEETIILFISEKLKWYFITVPITMYTGHTERR